MDSCTTALKYKTELVSAVPGPTVVRGGLAARLEEREKADGCNVTAFPACMRYVGSNASDASSSGIDMGNGTEQHESTTILGRPVMILRVLSSEYRLHHVLTNDSRFVAVAEGSSFRTCRPSEYADRRAAPTIVQALNQSVCVSGTYRECRLETHRLTCPVLSQ